MRATLVTFCLLGLCAVAMAQPIEKKDKDWWKNAVFYQIYPRSFKDSNNDGVGDLKGITSKLDHLKLSGITGAWLSPIYKSPQVDAGYDISDFRDIHEEYGTLEDFDELIKEARAKGIRIIMDLVPNHSSDKHEWFSKSANREPDYENYYIWRDGQENNSKPPNNWRSVFSGPAWTYNENRKQWYLHQFASAQPDLNYREPKVIQEMKDVMTFWMDRGVSGFRVDAVPHLFEAEGLPDEPLSNDPNAKPDDHSYLQHPYTTNQPETYDMVYQWREHIDAYPSEESNIMMTEAYADVYQTMGYYGNETREGGHFTFNFMFISELNGDSSAQDMVFTIQKWMTYMPLGKTANWVLGNHDNHRVATRYGKERADGLNMLHFLLPGVKVVYNGEEIGMEDGKVTYEEGQDPQGCNVGPDRYQEKTRDPERTPFHWDDSVNGGFNEGAKTWLPVSEKYKENNLKQQNNSEEDSHYRCFKQTIALKQHKTLQEGDLTIKPFNSRVIMLKRELPGSETFVLAFNIGKQTEHIDLRSLGRLPENLIVSQTSSGSAGRIGTHESTANLTLGPNEALILITESPIP